MRAELIHTDEFGSLLMQRMSTGQHHCPICAASHPANPRYPHAVCSACAAKATAADGRPLRFYNATMSGGLAGHYADTGEPYPHTVCLIEGHTCYAEEAHLGGVVIQAVARG
jgi:hypothetical protein